MLVSYLQYEKLKISWHVQLKLTKLNTIKLNAIQRRTYYEYLWFCGKKMVRKSTIFAPVAMALLFHNITRLTLMVTTPYHCINGWQLIQNLRALKVRQSYFLHWLWRRWILITKITEILNGILQNFWLTKMAILSHAMSQRKKLKLSGEKLRRSYNMFHYDYLTTNTCSNVISLDLEGNIVHNIQFMGGCNGNLQAISLLLKAGQLKI